MAYYSNKTGAQIGEIFDAVHEKQLLGHLLPATQEQSGLLSKEDKIRLDSLACVAFTGNYNQLINKPYIPQNVDSRFDEVNNYISNLYDITTNLENTKATKFDLNIVANSIPTKVSQLINDANYLTQHQSLDAYATKQWVLDKKYLTQHQSLTAYLKKSDAVLLYQPKGNYQPAGDYSTKQEVTNTLKPIKDSISKNKTQVDTRISELEEAIQNAFDAIGEEFEDKVSKGGLKTIGGIQLEGSGDILTDLKVPVTEDLGGTVIMMPLLTATRTISAVAIANLEQKLDKGGLKTINGQSIEGEGNITVQTSLDYATDTDIDNIFIN